MKSVRRDAAAGEHPVPEEKSAAGEGWDPATEFLVHGQAGPREQVVEWPRREAAARVSPPQIALNAPRAKPTARLANPRIPPPLR
jgi:hypothetical protein